MNRGLSWAYSIFKKHFWKYFRYGQMTSRLLLENVYAQFVLMNRGFTSTNIMLIWMLLRHPLTYLFRRGTRVLVMKVLSEYTYIISYELYNHIFVVLSTHLDPRWWSNCKWVIIYNKLLKKKTNNALLLPHVHKSPASLQSFFFISPKCPVTRIN